MNYDTIIKAFSEFAPCDNCNLKQNCKVNETSCDAFSSYVSYGRWKAENRTKPTHEKYLKIFYEQA